MSPRPGRITQVVEVDLGAERDEDTREDTAFFARITEVREALRSRGSGTAHGAVEDR
jgi:NitT/TauT family transport system ATP-binding protein